MASIRPVQELTPEEDEEAFMSVLAVASSSVLPMTLKAAIELDLLDILAKVGPGTELSPAEIAAQLPTENPQAAAMVDRILRLLAAYKIVSCAVVTDADGRLVRKYSAAPACKYLIKNEGAAAIALMIQDRAFMESWYYLKDAVLGGGVPFNEAHGMTKPLEHPGADPRFKALIKEGMENHSAMLTDKLLEIYRGFGDVEVLVDVGGGTGATLSRITSKYPHIKGINFDLPHVISQAPPFPGMEHVAGDMLASVPSGDAIFIKCIMHGWSDEHCVKILENCYKAVTENGKVMVVDYIVREVPEPSSRTREVLHSDMMLLTQTLGGRQRTEDEFRTLAQQTGFSGFKATYIFANAWVMEFTKKLK